MFIHPVYHLILGQVQMSLLIMELTQDKVVSEQGLGIRLHAFVDGNERLLSKPSDQTDQTIDNTQRTTHNGASARFRRYS